MSKISLEPNDSGAGTFTLAAPNSNTNRTLTLPDEAGTILSDASTIDSNNLQSDVYKQSNIIGTVSESGGVPTGAIVERGSNSNGQFVKYADGTMICSLADDTQVYGSLDSTGQIVKDINFPSVFFNKDSTFITVSLGYTGSGGSADVFTSPAFIRRTDTTLSTSGFQYSIHTEGNTGSGSYVCYIAFGRWY